jgi:hypothetical protein
MADRAPDAALRAGDAERERTAVALREHAAHGRLDVDELDTRLQAAYGARTRGELAELVHDLPDLPDRPASASPPARVPSAGALELKRRVVSAVVIVVFLIGIWAASGGGYFWPVWPALGLALAVGLHGAKLIGADRNEPPPPHRDEQRG